HDILLLLTGPILDALKPSDTQTDAGAAAAWREIVRQYTSAHPEQVLGTLRDKAVKGKSAEAARGEEPPCKPLSLSSLSALAALANRANQFFTIKVNIRNSLVAIAGRLESVLRDNDWVPVPPSAQPGAETDYVFARPPISSQKSTTVVITISTV